MIYTSYFAKLKSLPENTIPISICAKTPEWYKGLTYKKLAPSYNILMKYKRDSNKEDYTKNYREQVLANLNASKVVFELGQLADENETFFSYDICLLCYEKSTDFCHRHLVAEWLREFGYECEEWVSK